MGTVTDYLADLAEPERGALEHVVALARETVPGAEEGTGYGMPALTYRGRPLLSAVRAAKHLAVYPFSPAAVAAVVPRLDGWSHAKGTIRFSADHPLPDDVVRALVAARVAEIEDALGPPSG
ncbi:iron chaperone [Cellulosimicrobium sp. Marseille-Q8652]